MAENTERDALAESYLSRLAEFGNLSSAARALHETEPDEFPTYDSARGVLRRLRTKLMLSAKQGDSPAHDMTHTVPLGFGVKGVSTYYDETGAVRGQWVKSQADAEQQRAIVEEGLAALAEDLPRLAPVARPEKTNDKLCNLYTITDAHLGMLASEGEAGEKWGLEKAEAKLSAAFQMLIADAPPARDCVVAQLGDFLHSDGLLPVTPSSGHVLDQDARFADIVRTAVRLLRQIIDTALSVHENVTLIVAEGNHDMASSIWLRVGLENIYETEPRLSIVDNDLPYYAATHGRTMLGFHHGHVKGIRTKAAANELALQFASGPEWAQTSKRYIHTGHVHTEALIEVNGAKLISHPTFVAPDAYASRNYGGAHREITAYTYHADYGKVGSNTLTPEMVG